jgi:3-phenylpropionate/trans-cinnamate dioxygenase ferredoxin reductase subunit
MNQIKDIVLVGGGVASASAAEELRRQGYAGKVTLATRELEVPYHRPPITKQLLAEGGADFSVEYFPPAWWAEHDVDVLTRSAVQEINASQQTVTLANKSVLAFDRALVATGAMVRRLNIEGAALDGIHYLRTPANAHKLRAEAEAAERIVLVGGSFIAVEVAASLANRGHHCTLVMQEQKCLERTFGPTVAGYVEGLLRSHGVDLVGGTDVAAFTGESRVTGVRTADGTQIRGDLVVVGAGAIPDTKLAIKSGLEIGPTGGVLCDSQLRTSSPSIYAAGDMCEYVSVVHGRSIRVEHEMHAKAQGITAARNMLGASVDHTEVPYFWSDIADWTKLEYVGPARTWDEEHITGSVADGDFTVWYIENGRLVAALTSGRPQDLDVARNLIRVDAPTGDIHDLLIQGV